jgi:hypothetical protein
MTHWYKDLHPDTRVFTSPTGYTSSEIALQYLDHLIQYTKAGIDKPPKILLMDQHGSHMTNEFVIKATDANIHPFPFPSHLTHILQPLDVGVFQPYKHWHRKAVQDATRCLDIEYTVASFFRDLTQIREKTFKRTTIQGAFRKSGMWPINSENALEKMRTYQAPERETTKELELPPLTPTKGIPAERSLTEISLKIAEKEFSSPTQRKIDSTFRGVKSLLLQGEILTRELDDLTTLMHKTQDAQIRGTNRKVLQRGGALSGKEARVLKAQKEAQEVADKVRRRQNLLRTTENKIRKRHYDKGVIARKKERERKKAVQQLEKLKQFVPDELYHVIPDPEKLVTDHQIQTEVQEILISNPLFSGVSFDYRKEDPQKAVLRDLGVKDRDTDPMLGEFTSQQDYIALGCENTWGRDSIVSGDEFEEEEIQFSYL